MLKLVCKTVMAIAVACSVTACADGNLSAEGAINSLTDGLLENDYLNIDAIVQKIEDIVGNGFSSLLSMITDAINGILDQLKSMINIFEDNKILSTMANHVHLD